MIPIVDLYVVERVESLKNKVRRVYCVPLKKKLNRPEFPGSSCDIETLMLDLKNDMLVKEGNLLEITLTDKVATRIPKNARDHSLRVLQDSRSSKGIPVIEEYPVAIHSRLFHGPKRAMPTIEDALKDTEEEAAANAAYADAEGVSVNCIDAEDDGEDEFFDEEKAMAIANGFLVARLTKEKLEALNALKEVKASESKDEKLDEKVIEERKQDAAANAKKAAEQLVKAFVRTKEFWLSAGGLLTWISHNSKQLSALNVQGNKYYTLIRPVPRKLRNKPNVNSACVPMSIAE